MQSVAGVAESDILARCVFGGMTYRGNDGLQGGPPEGRGDHLALAVMKVVFRCDKASAQEVLHAILEEAALWQGHKM